MSSFHSDFTKAVNNSKGDVADAVGMPDEKDYETLLKIINNFERKNPGLIAAVLKAGRKDYETGKFRKNKTFTGRATVNKQSNMTYDFELPIGLYQAIEAVFPSMFKSRKHYRWFKKQFPKLLIAGE